MSCYSYRNKHVKTELKEKKDDGEPDDDKFFKEMLFRYLLHTQMSRWN